MEKVMELGNIQCREHCNIVFPKTLNLLKLYKHDCILALTINGLLCKQTYNHGIKTQASFVAPYIYLGNIYPPRNSHSKQYFTVLVIPNPIARELARRHLAVIPGELKAKINTYQP